MPAREWTEQEVNAAFAAVAEAKLRAPRGTGGELADFGCRPTSFLNYAAALGRTSLDRTCIEPREVVYAGAWLNGLMVGIALARGDDDDG